ncbi:MAG: hypothetical protein ACE5FB_06165 [Candidatus Binatia bacterium]
MIVEENQVQKSLLEDILDQTFMSIEEHETFDSETIRKLKQLMASGDLAKPKKVIDAIRSGSGGN